MPSSSPTGTSAGVAPAQVAAALREADLMLFPARPGEGFGLPLLEALASGVPSVASRLPSTEEMTNGAVALVPPDDVEAFADAARRLLVDPSAWRRARRAARRAASRYAPSAVADRLERAVRWAAKAGEGTETAQPGPCRERAEMASETTVPGDAVDESHREDRSR